MILVALYLFLLFIAPQLWIEPVKGLRVDFVLYPAWLGYVILRGRLGLFLRLRTQDWLFLGFILWCAISVVVNGIPENGPRVVFNLTKWFVLFRLTVASTAGLAGVRWATNLLVFFGLVLAVEGIQHYWSPDGLGWAGQTLGWVSDAAADVGLDKRTRWINIFDGPGVFCVAYTLALPFVVRYLTAPYGWHMRLAALIVSGTLLLAIFYTGSRGGWIATLVILGAWAALRRGISAPKIALLGVLGLLVAMLGPAYLTSTRDASRSAQYRVEMWAEGIEMVQQNPVFGIGRGRFAAYTGRLVAHNSAIEIMGEAGIPGFFLWIGIIYACMKILHDVTREAEDDDDLAFTRSLQLCLVGYLVSAMFVTLEYETFYFLLALAASAGEDLEEPPTFGRIDVAIIMATMLAFFVVLKGFVMLYFG